MIEKLTVMKFSTETMVAGAVAAAFAVLSMGVIAGEQSQRATDSTSSPALNVNDFICFQGAFASGHPYANCDGSTVAPVLNVNDFVCFQGRFAGGCQ